MKAYELFCVYFIGEACTQWDKVVQEMHMKDPWAAVNGSLNKEPRNLTTTTNPSGELNYFYSTIFTLLG